MRLLKILGSVVVVGVISVVGFTLWVVLQGEQDRSVGHTIEACNVAGRYIKNELGLDIELGTTCYSDTEKLVTQTADGVYQVSFPSIVVLVEYRNGWSVLRWAPNPN